MGVKYSKVNGIHVVEIPVDAFAIKMVDKKKKSCGENAVNAGFFANFKEQGDFFTLPVGHLVCDYEAENKWVDFYCRQRGKFDGSKFRHDASTYSNAFQDKKLSTLIIREGKAIIRDRIALLDCDYAISGVPIMRNGRDVTFNPYVMGQGWDASSLYATWHTFVGLKEDDSKVYVMALKTTTGNMVLSAEAFRKFYALGFQDVIKLDGGGSFYFNADGHTESTWENRQINTIITFNTGVEEDMTESQLRKSVVDIMTSWLGFNETNGKHKIIIDIYNSHKPLARRYKVKYTDEWCATTISAAFIDACLTDIAPTECSCIKMIELYKQMGRWQESDSYTPRIGDIIMYDWEDNGVGDNKGAPNHVGLVVAVNGKTIKVIEGNKNQAVAYRTLEVNGKYIRGFCLPDYASKAKTIVKGENTVEITLNVLQKGAKGNQVKALQALLIGAGYSCGTSGIDGDFGNATLSAVKKFQKDKKLTVDGSVGKNTWTALLS